MYLPTEIVYNPKGVFVCKDGTIFKAKNGQNIINTDDIITPRISENGYLFIADEDADINVPFNLKIKGNDGNIYSGEYVHRIVCFSFGDKDGRDYAEARKGFRCEIDHINMDKTDSRVENLQFVSKGINLFRAYYKRKDAVGCKERFYNYYLSLDEVDRMILDTEIKLDIEGKY